MNKTDLNKDRPKKKKVNYMLEGSAIETQGRRMGMGWGWDYVHLKIRRTRKAAQGKGYLRKKLQGGEEESYGTVF